MLADLVGRDRRGNDGEAAADPGPLGREIEKGVGDPEEIGAQRGVGGRLGLGLLRPFPDARLAQSFLERVRRKAARLYAGAASEFAAEPGPEFFSALRSQSRATSSASFIARITATRNLRSLSSQRRRFLAASE